MAATTDAHIAALRQRCAASIAVNPARFTDTYLRRFLAWRKNDIDVVAPLFDAHVRWYVDKKIATIVEDVERDASFDWMRANVPLGPYGGRTDRSGRPICYDRIGRINFKEVVARGMTEHFHTYFAYTQELMLRLLAQTSSESFLLVIDMEGLGWDHILSASSMISVMRDVSNMLKNHYPELVGKILIINAPTIFDLFFSIIRPIVPDGILAKREVCGSDFKKRLLEIAAPENLPVEWGGTCKEPLKTMAVSDGNSKAAAGSTSNGLQSVVVSASAAHEVVVDVPTANSWILYEFQTTAHDIGFGIVYGGAREVVVPLARFECAAQALQGRVQVPRPGRYTVLFDNSFSLLRAKTVAYRVSTHAPGTDAIAEAALQTRLQ